MGGAGLATRRTSVLWPLRIARIMAALNTTGRSRMHGIPHGQQSFLVRSWQDMFAKLHFELSEWDRTQDTDASAAIRSYRALNIAWTAWHLHDWFWEWVSNDRPDLIESISTVLAAPLKVDRTASLRVRQSYQGSFARALEEKYPSIGTCRILANAGKHSKAENRPDPNLLTRGAFVTLRQATRTLPLKPDRTFHDLKMLKGDLKQSAGSFFIEAAADWGQFFEEVGIGYPRIVRGQYMGE